MVDGSKVEEMRRQIEEARRAEEEALKADTPPPVPETITDEFIKYCLDQNERGDGSLYAELHRGKFVLVKNWGQSGEWLYWSGHHWEMDIIDRCHDAVENVAVVYEEYGERLSDEHAKDKKRMAEISRELTRLTDAAEPFPPELVQERDKLHFKMEYLPKSIKKCADRASRLRTMKGAKMCLEWAHKIGEDGLHVQGDDIDTKPYLLACSNGVINLLTGELQPGRPEDYLLRYAPVIWEGINATCPTFETFMREIHMEDDELVDFLYRLFGYSLTGLSENHFFGCFIGEGRNGKGTMFELFRWLLGDLAWNVSPELLLEQKTTISSAGPRADLMSLHGKRMIVASESDENRKISAAAVKLLTGGDTISARGPHDRKQTNITQTWKMFFYTNHVPRGMAADYAMRKRLLYIYYLLSFVPDPDPNNPFERKLDIKLPEKLRAEAPGILARLVRGFLEYRARGERLDPPAGIIAAVDELRKREDHLGNFFSDKDIIEIGEDHSVTFKELYGRFASWYDDEVSESIKYRPSKIRMSQWLEKNGYRREKPCGVATVYGLRLAPIGGDWRS